MTPRSGLHGAVISTPSSGCTRKSRADRSGQLESFEYPLAIPGLFSRADEPFNTIFIRAPCLHSLTPEAKAHTEVLATLPPECVPAPPPGDSPLGPADEDTLGAVMLRQGRKLVTSFHPELSGDARIHEFWVERCVLGRK